MHRILSIVIATLAVQVSAQENPKNALEQLNKDIENKPTPELFFQRAMAHKALGNLTKADIDLDSATKAVPSQFDWQLERCRVKLSAKNATQALNLANQSLKHAKNCAQRAEIHMIRAEAYRLNRRLKPSLQACQLAFKELPTGKIEWFIIRSENQLGLKLHDQRILGLKAGLKIYPDSILKSQLVDAYLDAKKYSEALTSIDQELPNLQWKAHWQIKQVLALNGLDRDEEALPILNTATTEIERRLDPETPDINLIADHAHVLILKKDRASAKSSLKQLEKLNAPSWMTAQVKRRLTEK